MTSSIASTLRIAVLSGGDSAEREVSVRSGEAVAAALTAAGHCVAALDPLQCDLAQVDWNKFDACFIALHGGAGEDGRVQQLLERLGVPYTGSGPQASQLAMSKSASKRRFQERRVPTPAYVVFDQRDTIGEIAPRVAPLGYPVIIKPDSQGSSLGVAIANTPIDLSRAIAEALAFDRLAIAEPLVRGREFTVAMLDSRPFPLIEIIAPDRVFSYDAKYHSSLTEYRFDFALSTAKRAEISRAATAAADAIGTRGLVRVDAMLGHDGQVWVLEVNTIPGMTSRSLAPQAALRAGLEMAELCDRLVRQCLTVAEVS
ncbi:MAG: D-alanine--D-alanine ligase [Planctomycetia bacterium]|nr:D-alanine--D-alanine ligase [Planctomycetia bacterium]